MKQLLLLIVLVLVLGIAGFLYRYTLERPGPVPGGIACTLEAKICPDGTAVGRTGPNCEFAACPTVDMATSSLVATSTATSTPDN